MKERSTRGDNKKATR